MFYVLASKSAFSLRIRMLATSREKWRRVKIRRDTLLASATAVEIIGYRREDRPSFPVNTGYSMTLKRYVNSLHTLIIAPTFYFHTIVLSYTSRC